MPSSVIGALRVELGLDSAQFDSGATDAERRAAKLAYNLGVALRKPIDAAVSLKGAIAGIAAGASVAAFAAATQRAFDYTDAIVDLADRTGASTKAIQEFRYAAQLSGSSVEAADQALEKFARTQGLAQAGSDAQVKLFRALGVTSKDFDTALRQTMDGLAKLPTIQQRNAAALQIFGKSAGSLTALLGQGSAGFNELAAEAQNLGIVLGDDLLRNAGQANDTLDRMKMIVNAQFAGVIAANATSITSLAVSIGQLTGSVIKFMSTNPEKALAIIGAIAGGRIAGLPGALVGGSAGLLYGAYQRTQGAGLGSMSNQELAGELRSLAKRARGIGDRPLLGTKPLTSQMQRDYNAIATRRQQIVAEIQRRRAPAAATPKVTGGTLPTIGNGEAAAAQKKAASDAKAAAREAERQAKEARQRDRKFADDMSRAEEEQLRSQLDLTANQSDRVVIQQALLDAEHKRNVQAIQNDEHYTDAQKAALLQKEREAAALKSRVLRIEDQEKQSQIALDRARADADNETDILSAKANLAKTAKERRDIELRLLQIQFAMLRAEQEKLRDDAIRRGDTEGQRTAEGRMRTLGTTQALATQDVLRRTQGPIGQLLDSVPRSAAEMDEALQAVAANGINSVVDGLTDAATGAKSLADVFKSVADDIIRQLIRIAVQRAIVEPLAKALFPGSSGSGFSVGDVSASTIAALDSLPGRDKGGPVTAGRSYWVGERKPEIFTPSVSGRIIANDDIPMSSGRGDLHQHFSIPVGTGLATRADMALFAGKVKGETLGAMSEMQARRG